MKRILLLIVILAFIFPATVEAKPLDAGSSVKIPNGPSFTIYNVDRGESVTVRIRDFPDGKVYRVYLGRTGDNFGRGYDVGQLTDRLGTNYKKTFKIPEELRKQTHIAILIKNNFDGSHGYDIFANDTGFDSKTEMSFTPVHRSSAQSAGKSVGIFNGPGYWAGNKGYPSTFSLGFENFYDANSYSVFVGENNGNFQNILVGYVSGKNGPALSKTFDMPDELSGADEIKVMVVNAFNGHSGSVAFKNEDGYPSVTPYGYFTETYVGSSSGSYSSTATPFTNVLNVVIDGEVTLQVFNFPPGKEFIVTMGPMGTRGIGGYVIGTQSSGEGGSFIVTYPIPPQLYGSDYIAIRLESTTSDHFAYDYFQNNDGYTATSSGTPSNNDWVLAAGTYPSTSITSSVKDQTVTVSGTNFTRNDTYIVRMGPIGTQGVNGIVVDNFNTGASGSFTATFTIPGSLQGAAQIAIRFESTNAAYYAYDWFYNKTAP